MNRHLTRAVLEPGQLISYELPLRPEGLSAYMTLPCDLTAEEAERVATFVKALAFETPPGPGGGS
ncbi:MAG TPA: hypothetical protein VIV12_09930 [Streptosporangiaceae bacterium]